MWPFLLTTAEAVYKVAKEVEPCQYLVAATTETMNCFLIILLILLLCMCRNNSCRE